MSDESDTVSDATWERLARAIADVRLRARAEGRISSLEEYGLRLDVSARWVLWPVLIGGEVDGRGFYLHHPSGSPYEVAIAPDEDPTTPHWEWEPGHPPTVIASGPINDLCGGHGGVDQFVTLDVAVDAVRRYLLRASCEHETPRSPDHRYCGRCGTRITGPGKSATMVRVAR